MIREIRCQGSSRCFWRVLGSQRQEYVCYRNFCSCRAYFEHSKIGKAIDHHPVVSACCACANNIFVGALMCAYMFGCLFEVRSEEHTSELQSRPHLVCRLLLEKKKKA